jgi:hypothetical protein
MASMSREIQKGNKMRKINAITATPSHPVKVVRQEVTCLKRCFVTISEC